jgi:WD40 repeat protein
VAAFSPDGKAVLTGNWEGAAQLWDASTGREVGPALAHGCMVEGVGFSPDGARLWTAARDDTVREWDRATGKLLRSLATPGKLGRAVFSPNGVAALVYGGNRYIQFRNVATWPAMGPLVDHRQPPDFARWSMSFSRDGLLAVSVGHDRAARLWDTVSGKPLGVPLTHLRYVYSAVLRPDGRMVAVGGDDGIHLWELPAPVKGTARQVRVAMEVDTGLELDEQGSAHALSPADEEQRRRDLQRLGGMP